MEKRKENQSNNNINEISFNKVFISSVDFTGFIEENKHLTTAQNHSTNSSNKQNNKDLISESIMDIDTKDRFYDLPLQINNFNSSNKIKQKENFLIVEDNGEKKDMYYFYFI